MSHITTPIRVLIVDDHPIARLGIEMVLKQEEDIVVIGLAEDGCEGIKMARACQPDIILMNYMMPCLMGDEATAHILAEFPHMKILIHTIIRDMILLEAWQAGAKGVLRVGGDIQDWLYAIRTVHQQRDGRTNPT